MLSKLNLRSWILASSFSLLAITAALGQSSSGPEIRLNSQSGVVFDLDVTAGSDGIFTTVWTRASDPYQGFQQIVARRLSRDGASNEMSLVQASLPYHVIELPRVAPAAGGAWTIFYSQSLPNGYEEIFGSRFSNQGSRLGSRFQVSPGPKSTAQVHAVTRLPSDGYFVLSEDDLCLSCQAPLHHVFARVLAADGTPTSPYFLVDTETSRTGFCGAKSLGSDSLGNVVAVWEAQPPVVEPKQTSIVAQRFSPSGQRLASTFLITKPSSAIVFSPSVTVNPAGDFIVVWQYQPDPNTPRSLHARHFSKDAKPMGKEFVVEADSVADAIVPSIASDSHGNYVVVWTSYGSPYCPSVKGRLYRPDDTPAGPAFYLSSGTNTCDQFPKVAFGPNGTFAVAWIRLVGYLTSDIYAATFRINP
jgi:hypothetical protein